MGVGGGGGVGLWWVESLYHHHCNKIVSFLFNLLYASRCLVLIMTNYANLTFRTILCLEEMHVYKNCHE